MEQKCKQTIPENLAYLHNTIKSSLKERDFVKSPYSKAHTIHVQTITSMYINVQEPSMSSNNFKDKFKVVYFGPKG